MYVDFFGKKPCFKYILVASILSFHAVTSMYFAFLLKHQFLNSSINLLAILLPRYSSKTYKASNLAVFSLTKISSVTYSYI